MTATVTFWKVTDSKQKVSCVSTLVNRFFHQAQRQLIVVPNQQAADYIDNLLWRFPKESFVPHTISSQPIQAAVVITMSTENLNNAGIVINLCPTVTQLGQSTQQVHELFDCTDPAKEQQSSQRKAEYERQGLTVSICPWL
jgi:DNA polymerase-3 subunit chi